MYKFLITICQKKVDLHVQFFSTDSCKKSVVIVGIRLYNKRPNHIQKVDQNKPFKRELRSFLLQRVIQWMNICHIDDI